jgi:hypothetical protein
VNGLAQQARSTIYDWLKKINIIGDFALEFVEKVESRVSANIDWAISKIRESLKGLQKAIPSNLPIIPSDVQMVVNVYGSKDILAETGIGGFRSELFGYSVADRTHQLYNIEILGADHFDYMRGILPDRLNDPWNKTVSDFITRLTLASKSKDELDRFLSRQPLGVVTQPDSVNDFYVINLPGHP